MYTVKVNQRTEYDMSYGDYCEYYFVVYDENGNNVFETTEQTGFWSEDIVRMIMKNFFNGIEYRIEED